MIDVYNDEKKHVWCGELYVGASSPDQLLSRVFVHPIDKILLLVEMNEDWSTTEEPYY